MPRQEIEKSALYADNIALQKAAQQYKNYNSIRRDLRQADEICTFIISIHNSIKTGQVSLELRAFKTPIF